MHDIFNLSVLNTKELNLVLLNELQSLSDNCSGILIFYRTTELYNRFKDAILTSSSSKFGIKEFIYYPDFDFKSIYKLDSKIIVCIGFSAFEYHMNYRFIKEGIGLKQIIVSVTDEC